MKRLNHTRPIIRRLEPRVMFDGAAVDTTAHVVAQAPTDAAQTTDTTTAPTESAQTTTSPAPTEPAQTTTSPAPTDSAPASTNEQQAWVPPFEMSDDPTHQIIVVDASVPNADELIAAIAPGWTVIRLNAGRDGLTQLLEAIAGRTDIKAIHIFSHGGAGQIILGSSNLSTDNLAGRAPDLAALGSHLTTSGDLMLYGCGVAADFAGQAFVSQLAALTHADVAASEDATGSITMGGDWELESQTGTIDTTTLSDSQYNDLLAAGDAIMNTGEASDSINFSSNRYSSRLYWQASGAGGYGNTGDTAWVDQYTSNQVVKYWGTGWSSFSYPAWRWAWFPIYMETVWFSYPSPMDWNYGSGTRYATQTITLEKDSDYQFDVTATKVYKDKNGQEQTVSGLYSLNTALYKGTFDPTNPLKNLVTASESANWSGSGAGQLQKGELAAGNYTVVTSFDTLRWIVSADNNVWWSGANNYAQQLWGDFKLTVTNLNSAPVWTTRDLSQTLDGPGIKSFTIPPALGGNITLSDADGDALTVTAKLSNGSALPSWLTFDAQSMTFTGNPPANTGTLAVRLSATDGQLTSLRDFTITYTNDNDQPVVAVLIPDQAWNGAGSFSYQIPSGTFTDSDPSGSNLAYTATLTDGSALPNWLNFNPANQTLSGNPPANFAGFDIKITVNDGSGQTSAAQSDTFTLRLTNNNDIPTVSDITKSVAEDGTLSFTAVDFVYSDLDTHATNDTTVGSGRTLQAIRILALPGNGTLWLDTNGNASLDAGETVAANQVIAYASLGLLRYTPRADWAGGTGGVANTNLSTSPDSFTWTATDSVNDAAAPATTRINVTQVNDAPLLAFSEGRTLIVRPNTGNPLATPVYVDKGLQVTDADALYTSDSAFDTIYGATVSVVDSVSNTFQSGDLLAATAGSGITVSYDSATGTLKLSGTATAAAYQTVLRTLQFSSTNTSNDNLREISIVLRTADVGSKTSAVFDGVNDYVETQRGSIPMAGDYSLSVWARFDGSNIADGSQYTILSQGSASGNSNFFIQLNRVGSNYNLRLGDNWLITNGYPMDGKWHQFTVVKSGNASGNGTLYIDGIKTATGNLASVEGNSLRIGRLYRLSDTQDYDSYWQGAISDLRIYDRTLNLGEINTSLDSTAALTGYEANLLAWYPLLADFDNHAVTTWDFGRDYNPYNPSLSQGPWSMGVITGNKDATGNFNSAAFQALTADTAKITTNDKYVQYDNAYFPYGNTSNGWARFLLPNNTAEGYTYYDMNIDPGVVALLPGYVNPAALQFAAPVAGVYSIDARFWSTFSSKNASWPTYKVFRVAANGTVTELTGAGGTVAGTTAANAAVSGLKQVVLNAGEKLLFAVHKGDAVGVSGDEVNTLIRCDLLAAKTADGYYYSLEDGHYYGLSSTTTNSWDTAASNAASLSTAGQSGYLATPTSATAARITGALVQRSYEDGGTPPSGTSYEYAHAGFKQLNTSAEPAGNWFWMSAASDPANLQPFDGQWATNEPNNTNGGENYGSVYRTGTFNDSGATNNMRYLVEFGGASRLAAPVELSAALSLTRDPGNALVYKDTGVAWSARTGHYYQLTSTASDFTSANGASYTYDSVSGYLARLASLSETDLAAYQLRLGSASGAWVGLQSSDPASNGQLVWKWNSGPSAATTFDPSLSRTDISTPPAGQVLVSYDDFQNGSNGWVLDSNNSSVGFVADGLTTADGTANKVMGNYGTWIRKDYQINNQATTISFVLNRLDSWDTENFYVRLRSDVDNLTIYDQIQFPLVVITNYSSISPILANEAGGSRTIRLALGDVTVTPVANYGNFTASNWSDQSFRVTLKLNAGYGNNMRLYFGSSLDSGGADESYSIDNVALYQAASTANTNVGLGGTLDTFTNPSGWVSNGLIETTYVQKWDAYTTIGGNQALWFTGGNPTKTFQIDNDATRIEFDAYTLDSWDNEQFSTYINRSAVFTFNRSNGVQITNAWSGTAMISGKVVNYTVTPGTYGEFYGTTNWNEQKFHVVIDLPEDFGSTFELTFDNNLNEVAANESGAIDNVQVYSRDNAGWIDSRGMLTADNNAAITPQRLDQFRSINLYTDRYLNDNDWDIMALATDGKSIYTYYGANNYIFAYGMDGVEQRRFSVSGSTLGSDHVQMAYSAGWLYIRNPGAYTAGVTDNPADDKIYRISPTDGSNTLVTVDSTQPLLGGTGWATGSLFNMPDGRLGIVSTIAATGATTVRLYTLADNGTRLVWSQDYTLNVGANWLSDSHGSTSDGRYLYILRWVQNGEQEYKVFDLTTGALAIDGTPYNLYQQSVDNAGYLTRDPLTGDIYFADINGSHIARVQQPASAQRLSLIEYGAEGATLAAPLLVNENSALPDRFVSDTRSVQVRVGNTAPSASAWSASTAEDTALTLSRSQFAAAFSDPELDTLYSITLQSVPAVGAGSLSLNGTTLSINDIVYAGDLDKLVFTPSANFNGSASFSYKAGDGNLMSSAAASVTITVNAVNDAPVLNIAGSPTLNTIAEDVPDASNTGTTVAYLVVDGSITDADVSSAPEAIAVTRVDNTHGVWQFSTNAGSTWTVFSNITGGIVELGAASRLLDSTNLVRFVPVADWNGSVNLNFRAWDQTAGTAGSTTDPNAQGGNTSVSAAEETASLTVSAVNDAPTSANATITMDEDTTYTLGASNFSFSDVDTLDSLQAVTITTLPTAGTLTLNNVAVTTAGTVVSLAELTAGQLKFTPAANAFGNSYASIGFTVNDGTTSSTAQILTINVTDTNDAPTAIAWKVVNSVAEGTVAENSASGTVVGHLVATDPNTGDTLRFAGISNSNFSISPDGTVTVSNLAALDFERTPTQTLGVRVTDAGGLSYETTVTITLSDVVEDAPTLITNSFYITKSGTLTLSESQLKATDAQQAASSLTYSVKEAPSGGTWWLDANGNSTRDAGEDLAPVNEANPNGRETFTHADVVAGKLHFIQDGTQSNSKLSLSLSDGTAASTDANGNPLVTGMLVAIVSSPPVLAPVADQQWSTSGAQTLTLPANTFTDPDMDTVAVTATLADGTALPAWLSFNASTWTFSGTPSGYSNDQFIDIKISGTDGRTAAVNDVFRIVFKDTITAPVITNPIPEQVFDGAGIKTYTLPADTFAARGSNLITGYTASNLPSWLTFDTGTKTFTGNPPQSAQPGPYWITVTATATDATSTSTVFRLIVTNANDQPVEAAPVNTAIPDKTISGTTEATWVIPSDAFTDGDGDTLTLRAGNADGSELPSWVRFDPATRTFTAKAPAGSGTLIVRVFADDGQGGSGYADFNLAYSGGVNEAPQVMTSEGVWYMDLHTPAELTVADGAKAQQFTLSQGSAATITREHLKEMDADDDGAGLTYTLTQLPAYGQLWLDSDGDGTLSGAESTLNVGNTFTQADIDAGKLRYRHTGTTSQTATVNDKFTFNLADGGENGALAVQGVQFLIVATPTPAAPTLMNVVRSSPVSALTNADSVSFEVSFSEAVKGVDVADFAATGDLAGSATVQSVSVINGSKYLVTLAGSGLANANGTLGLQLASTPSIDNKAGTASVDTSPLTAQGVNESYTLDNIAPVAALTGPALHNGSTAFWINLDFGSDAVNDLALADLSVTGGNATLSDLQRISTDPNVDPDTPPANYDPNADVTLQGNRYRVKVTPTSSTTDAITVALATNGVTDNAGNGNTTASVTIAANSKPTVTLDAASPASNNSTTFTERDGTDDGSGALAFTTAGSSLADINTSQNLAWLNIAIANTQFTDGAAETLRINGTAIALNFADGAAIANIVLGSTTYSITASNDSTTRSLRFAKSGGGTLTLAEAETLLDALQYNNSSDTPSAATRSFAVTVNDGMETSAAATFAVTVAATNDTPVISIGTGDSASASLTETNAKLTASGTLSVLDRDVSDTVTVSKVSVVASSTTTGLTSDNAALLAMLALDSGNVIDNTHTTGTIHWAFDSASQIFDYLANGETLTLTYTIRATDSATSPAQADQTVVVTITGSNDAPKVTASSVSALDNTTPTNVTASGRVTFSDIDASNTPTATKTATSYIATRLSGSSTFTLNSAAITALGNALTVTAADGNWSYALDTTGLKDSSDVLILLGDKVAVTYTVTIADAHGGNTVQELQFTLIGTGTGGTLVVSGDAGSIVEGSPSTLSDAGSLTFATVPSFASVSVDATPTITASSLTLTTDQINAIKAGLTVSYVDNASTDVANWTYSISEAALDFLPAGQTVTAVFVVQIYDNATTPALLASQNVTILIQGTNDAPVITSTAAAAEGSVTEASTGVTDTASGTLTASDVDSGATQAWSGNATGTYGSLAITSAGVWTYTLNNADTDTQALAAGQTAVETFTAAVSDGTANATQQIRITVTGSNDAPVLSTPTVIAYTDTSGNDSFTNASDTLSATDSDTSDTRSYAITDGSADTSRNGFTHSKSGSYGTLYLNALTGAYDYVPDAIKMNAAIVTVNDDFTLKTTDAAGTNSNTATLRVTITGVNDTPTLVTGSGSDNASLYETDSGLTASGRLTAGDLDTSQTLAVTIASGTTQLNTGSVATMDSTQLGWLTVAASTQSGDTSTRVWNFNSASEAFNSLRAGDTLKLTYTVRVNDGTATADKTVTITIHGTNDAPLISIDTTGTADTATAAISETNAANRTASGTLTVADAEAADTLTASVTNVAVSGTAARAAAPSDAVLLAMLSLTPTSLLTDGSATLATHGLTWSFNSGSATFDQLAAGETLILTYTLRVVDNASGAPGMDTQIVTITLTGTNDAPTVTAGDVTGNIASGFPAQLFDSGSVSFTDLDLSDRPTASVTQTTVTGAVRNGAPGSLTLSAPQQTAIANAFTLAAASSNTNNGTVDWNYAINQADIDYLGSGQSVTAVFRVTVNDSHGGTGFQDVTVILSGQNNVPVITVVGSDSDTKALTETNAALSTSGTLTVTDTNLTDAVTATVLSGTVKRNSGSVDTMTTAQKTWLTLTPSTVLSSSRSAASGSMTWTFNSGSETFNDLAAGETLTLTYTVNVTDDAPSPASDTQTVTLTITGTNDAPTITLVGSDLATAGLTETDAALSQSGTLTVGDLDTANTVTASVHALTVSGTSNRSDPAAPGDLALKAMLSLNPTAILDNTHTSASLGWTFASTTEKFNYLVSGETLILAYTVRVTDSDGVTADQIVTITLTGSNDIPTISGGPVAENLAETDGPLSALGTLTVGDLDTRNTVVASRTLSVSGSSNRSDPAAPNDAALLAMLQITPTTVLDASQISNSLDWTFNSGTEKFNYLAAGETLVLTYTVNVADNNASPASATTTITLTLTGSNDAPVITVGSSDSDSAALTETNAALSAQGTLSVFDVDTANTVAPSVLSVAASGVTTGLPADNATLKAMLSVDTSNIIANTANTGTLHWAFASGNEYFNYLAQGEQLVLTYTVRATDSSSGTGDYAVTLTITGTNDAPTVSIATPAAIAEATDAHAQALSQSGNIAFADLDASDQIDVAFTSNNNVQWSGGSLDSTLATALVNGFSVAATNAPVTATVNWSYNVNSANLDFLAAGETITFSYTVSVTDAQGQQMTAPVAFTLTGTNDVPVVTNASTAGSVTEAGHADDGSATSGTPTVTGTLTSSDVDTGATRTWQLQGTPSTTYGSIALDASTGVWIYSLDNTLAATQALKEGESVTQTYTARATDNVGAYVDQTLTVTIIGTNDVPVVTNASTAGSVTEAGHADDGSATSGTPTVTGTLTSSDVDTGATRTWQLQGTPSTTYGSIALDASTGVWIYSLDNTLAATQALKEGESVTQTYTARATDNVGAYVDQTLTVTIIGTNDVPVVTNASTAGSVTEAGHADDGSATSGTPTVTGTLTSSDVDTGATRTWQLQGTPSTTYGSIALDASTGVWIYSLNNSLAATQALKEGESVTQTYTARATDNVGAYVDQTLTVTIIGTNDVPVVTNASTAGSVTEAGHADDGSATSGTPTVTGTLTSSDVDTGATRTWQLQGTPSTTYGSIALDASTGVWIYSLNNSLAATQALKEGESVTQTYTARATDDFGAYVDQTLTVTINGTNDVPVVTNASTATAGSVTEAGHADDGSATSGTPTVTGTLTSSDVDTGATRTWQLQGTPSTTYGSIALDASTGVWIYSLNNSLAATQALKEGESVTQTYTARATDDFGAYVDQTLTVTINGTNDVPVVTNASTATAGSVTEAGHADDGSATSGTPTVTGTLTSSDVDTGATRTWQLQGTPSTTYGSIALDASTGVWIYSLNNSLAATQALKEGESVTQTYTARATDDFGAYVDQTLTVTINGTNDVPVVTNASTATAGSVTEAGHADDGSATSGTPTVTGTLTSSDVDTGATRTWQLQGTPSTTYGSIALDASTGVWIYSLNNSLAATQALKEGESVTQTYTARATDNVGAYVDQTLTVTIIGTNDVPVVTNASTAGSVTEAGHADDGSATSGTPTVTGTLTSSDVDTGATRTWQLQGTPSTTYGSIALDASTGVWIYSLNNSLAATQALKEGESVTQTYTARATDDFGAYVDQTLTVTINGTNDVPVVTNASTATAGSVTEAGHADDGSATSGTPTVTGTLTSSDVDTGATRTWQLQGTPSTTYGSIALDASTGVWIYSLNNSLAATQALKEGESVTQTYTARATDDFGAYVDQTLTVTINGTNDVPVVTNASTATAGSVTEAGHADDGSATSGTPTVTGTLTSSDVDTGATRTWQLQGTPSTTYGSIALDASTGVWIYSLNNSLAATQALKEGESVTQTYTARATDNVGAYVDQTLTVTIIGTNDVPVVTNASTAGSVTEAGHADDGSATSGTPTVTGTLTSSDVDTGATRTWQLQGTPSTTYGSIALDASTGVWIYSLDNTLAATQALKEGESVTQTYTARATDNVGAYVDQTLTVTIIGTNDVPVVTNASTAGSVTEAGHADDGSATSGTPTVTGTLTSSDVDTGATRTWQLQGTPSTTYGSIALDASTGVWIYSLDNTLAATQALKEGESVTQTYTARATDNVGAYVDQTLTVTIIGTNDVPVVTNASTAGSVTEAGHADDGSATSGTPTVTGTLTSSDVDTGATRTWQLQGTPSTTYGSIALDASTGVWIYSLDNTLAATQALKEGESVTQTYTARATDNVGAYVDQTLTVTIIGTNDVPVVTTGIDNFGFNEAADASAQDLSSSGTLSFNDIDVADVIDVTSAVTTAAVWSGGTIDANLKAALEAGLNISGTDVAAPGSVNWTYTVNDVVLDFLAQGETITLTYTVTVTDNNGATATDDVTITITGTNDAPVRLGASFADQQTTVGNPYIWTVPAEAFDDVDHLDIRTFSATLANGQPLPTWLLFNPATLELYGTPATNESMGLLTIRITATDRLSATVTADLILNVLPAPPPPQPVDTPPAPPPPPLPSGASQESAAIEPQPLTFGFGQLGVLTDGIPPSNDRWLPATKIFVATDRESRFGTNESLFVNAPVRDSKFAIGSRVVIQLAADTFSHTNPRAKIILSAMQADGKPLPTWLTFLPKIGRFEGIAPLGFRGILMIRVVARDQFEHEAVQIFKIELGETSQEIFETTPQEERTAPARAGLSEQFRQASRNTLRSHLATLAESKQAPISRNRT